MSTNETILVTGATGQQGGAVARCLLSQRQNVRALTRNPAKAEELKRQGAEVVAGDLNNRDSVDSAVRGVNKILLITTPFEAGMDAEVQQAINVVDAAKTAGVDHLVYHSVAAANEETGIPHFETKWKVEQHIRETGISYTIIRPVFFMENFYSPWFLPMIRQGKLVLPMPVDRPLQMISLRNIGEFGAAALMRKEEFCGKEIAIAGDELTLDKAMKLLSEALGKTITYEQLPDEKAAETFGPDFAKMFSWFTEVGYSVDIPTLEQQWGISLIKYKSLITDESIVKRFG